VAGNISLEDIGQQTGDQTAHTTTTTIEENPGRWWNGFGRYPQPKGAAAA
jgi:hypothetical protein